MKSSLFDSFKIYINYPIFYSTIYIMKIYTKICNRLIPPAIRKKFREHVPFHSKRRNITSIIYYYSSNPCPPFVSRAPPKLRSMGLEADRSRGVTGIISMSRILMSVRRWRQLVLISGTHLPQLRLVSTATLQPSRFRHDVRPIRSVRSRSFRLALEISK